jgi:deoxyribodipyrimidine photo-lyase
LPDTAILLLTRDLRIHDHPALCAALELHERVVPLFVFDDAILSSGFVAPNRVSFLLDCLHDLDSSLKERGGRLFVRRGDVAEEVTRTGLAAGAAAVYMSADYSGFARRREARLRKACRDAGMQLRTFPGIAVVPPGTVRPSNGRHYEVFSTYHGAWEKAHPRAILAAADSVPAPSDLDGGAIPPLPALVPGKTSPRLPAGGERRGRELFAAFLRSGLGGYARNRNDLPGEGTSRISAYLHFGCLSPAELVSKAEGRSGGAAFVRQLCRRDFFLQVLAATPGLPRDDYRPRGHPWSVNEGDLAAWKEGRTGYPIVDAGMRQLMREGYMAYRARLITASFLTKGLRIDWRKGARHFADWLVDGDVASNSGNWRWVAGTGNDAPSERVFDPIAHARRSDPDGDYVRRYVEGLRGVEGPAVHEPWRLDADKRAELDYPDRIVDLAEAVEHPRTERE